MQKKYNSVKTRKDQEQERDLKSRSSSRRQGPEANTPSPQKAQSPMAGQKPSKPQIDDDSENEVVQTCKFRLSSITDLQIQPTLSTKVLRIQSSRCQQWTSQLDQKNGTIFPSVSAMPSDGWWTSRSSTVARCSSSRGPSTGSRTPLHARRRKSKGDLMICRRLSIVNWRFDLARQRQTCSSSVSRSLNVAKMLKSI